MSCEDSLVFYFDATDLAMRKNGKVRKSLFIYFLSFVRFVEASHNCSFKFKSQVIPFGDRLPFVSSILDRIHSNLETTPLKVEYVADATGTSLVDLNKEETTDVTNVRVASPSATQPALAFWFPSTEALGGSGFVPLSFGR